MSSYRDENRPSTLVAFSLSAAGGSPAAGSPATPVEATLRAVVAAAGLAGGKIVRQAAGEPSVADFRESSRAFGFALEALRMAARYNERHADAPLEVRLGVHHDTLWFVGEDVIGDAPVVAAHLAGIAEPGTVCASTVALSRMGSTAGWDLAERGSTKAPGVETEIPFLEARPRASQLLEPKRQPEIEREPRADQGPEARSAPVASADPRRPAWANIPLPPRPPGRTAGQDIIAGLTEIGKAVVSELAERSRNISEEKVRAAIRSSAGRHELARGEWNEESGLVEEGDAEPASPALERRKEKAARKAARAIAGFVSHLTSFALVGAGLLGLNIFLTGGFPWAYFPIAGWGIGLICHWQSVRSARRRNRELKSIEAVSSEQLALVDKIQRTESGMGGHTASYVAVIGFLAGINLITSSGFLWCLFPALGWGIGYVMHLTNYLARRTGLVRRLGELGISWNDVRSGKRVSGGHRALGGATRVSPDMEHAELVREARSIRDDLLTRLSEHEEIGKRMGSEVTALLTTYAEQLEKLVLQNHEFRKALESMPEAEVERDMAEYRARIESAEHPALRKEYESALDQGERQLRSIREVKHQKEILGVRIQSAFGLLKQLELDFVRLKSVASSDDVQSLASIRSRSDELSDYLEGLNEVEREVERDAGREKGE